MHEIEDELPVGPRDADAIGAWTLFVQSNPDKAPPLPTANMLNETNLLYVFVVTPAVVMARTTGPPASPWNSQIR
ncbi:unnamed protein product [Notodromas monacha]|uniref:Uncharacterized protein n=1 Tax=Notodromas monacha TaxID=399045 RepID=A0A7R9BS38_9CRUS|nr:unnamed protein product [Notodromas monacha]CAG0920332.1 unnamed protein product [Notodromas monacha]